MFRLVYRVYPCRRQSEKGLLIGGFKCSSGSLFFTTFRDTPAWKCESVEECSFQPPSSCIAVISRAITCCYSDLSSPTPVRATHNSKTCNSCNPCESSTSASSLGGAGWCVRTSSYGSWWHAGEGGPGCVSSMNSLDKQLESQLT